VTIKTWTQCIKTYCLGLKIVMVTKLSLYRKPSLTQIALLPYYLLSEYWGLPIFLSLNIFLGKSVAYSVKESGFVILVW